MTSANVPLSGLTDSYFLENITPVTLTGGQQYTVAAWTGNNPWAWGGAPIVNPAITFTYGSTHYAYGSPAFPTGDYFVGAYYGPNFSIGAVPEPTTIISGAMLVLPFGAGAVGPLRKKLQAA